MALCQFLEKFIYALIGNHIQENASAQFGKEPVDPRAARQLILVASCHFDWQVD